MRSCLLRCMRRLLTHYKPRNPSIRGYSALARTGLTFQVMLPKQGSRLTVAPHKGYSLFLPTNWEAACLYYPVEKKVNDIALIAPTEWPAEYWAKHHDRFPKSLCVPYMLNLSPDVSNRKSALWNGSGQDHNVLPTTP